MANTNAKTGSTTSPKSTGERSGGTGKGKAASANPAPGAGAAGGGTGTGTGAGGPRMGIPPRIIGESVRAWGQTILAWFGLALGLIMGVLYFLIVPFPDNWIIKAGLGFILAGVVWAYFAIETRPSRTAFHWTIIYLAALYSNIPRHTRSRDTLGGGGGRN